MMARGTRLRTDSAEYERLEREGRIIKGDHAPIAAPPKQNKYHAKRTLNCPHCRCSHDSQVEAARCGYWHLLIDNSDCIILGAARHIDVHPMLTLPGGIRYCADFLIWYACGEVGIEDVKAPPIAAKSEFRRIKKLVDAYHPAGPLRVVFGRKVKGVYEWTEQGENR